MTPAEERVLAVLERHGGYADYETLGREALLYEVPFGAAVALRSHASGLRRAGYDVRAVRGRGLENHADQRAPRPWPPRRERVPGRGHGPRQRPAVDGRPILPEWEPLERWRLENGVRLSDIARDAGLSRQHLRAVMRGVWPLGARSRGRLMAWLRERQLQEAFS